MNKLIAAIKRAPKSALSLAVMASAILVPAVLLAWGPTRPTFTMANPAPYVTFNSITDNPSYGDERQFVTVRDMTTTPGNSTKHEIELVEGHEYMVYAYIHNNASETLNASGKGVALGTKIQSKMPTSVNGSADVKSYIYASNASPKEVYDNAVLKSSKNVELEYVTGSAKIKTHFFESALSDSMVTVNNNVSLPLGGGVPIGHKDLSGKWNGCSDFTGYVTYRFKVKQPFTPAPDVDINKTVNNKEHEKVKVNQQFNYEVTVKNTGNVDLTNVKVTDAPQAGVTLVSADKGVVAADGKSWSYTIPETLKPNQSMTFNLKAVVKSYVPGIIKNTACVDAPSVPGNPDDCDDATVEVEETIYKCEGLSVDTINRTNFKFTATHSVKNAEYVRTVFVVRNEAGAEIARVDDTDGVLNYTQNNVGKYTVEAIIVVKVDGVEKTTTDAKCKKPFEVKAEEVKLIKVCELDTKKIIKIAEKDFDSKKHSTKLSDCDTPTVPEELPKTGMTEDILGIFGAGSVVAASAYYTASRRKLLQ